MKFRFKMLSAISVFILISCWFTTHAQSLRIAFGSCNHEYDPQDYWKTIKADKPNVWLWLGDNIYGDAKDVETLKAKYAKQLAATEYQDFIASTKVIGTWDDHDYGINDGNKYYPLKKQSQQLALDFLGEPQGTKRRKQEGIYQAYDYSVGNKSVKVLLLDVRYNQDSVYRDAKRVYHPTQGDILGKKQWKWLEKQLKHSKADATVIASGIQIAINSPFESWYNFPNSQKRLATVLAKYKAKGVLFLSGDRHSSEISRVRDFDLGYPVYEFTSSGLTHAEPRSANVPNPNRIGNIMVEKSYGVLDFKVQNDKLSVSLLVKDIAGKVV